MKKLYFSFFIIVLILCTCKGPERIRSYDEFNIKNINLKDVQNGIYYGVCKFKIIKVKVMVVVNENKISKIDITKHRAGKGRMAEIITDKVIDAQSLQVDAISGATYSSKTILKAIENALKKGIKN